MGDVSSKTAIECRGITKTFGSVVANDHIDLNVEYGEILALLGENGSGKTTLMNMLSGIYHPDEGEILLNKEEVHINSPIDAANLGIGMIHQHFKLVERYTAMDNIVIGTRGRKMHKKEMCARITEIADRFGLEIDPMKRIYDMSVSEKQTVEIMKVLYKGAKILILDEPTAVLTPQEIEKLFAILRKMKEEGSAIIIITHKLNEVLEISDRVTILRKGQSIGSVVTKETDENELTELMVGRAVSLEIERPECEKVKNVMKVANLNVYRPDGSHALKNVDFSLHGGQILGVAGVAGSGQKELCEVMAGIMKAKSGSILYHGDEVIGKTPAQIMKMGISMSFVPEDRLGMGLVASMGITENMMLKSYRDTKGQFLDKKPARKLAEKLVEKLQIVTPGIESPVRLMSGGNVQKVLLGREIEAEPEVLVTAYPVRGLDINSSYVVYDLLNEQKKKGVAVMFIGEDLDVLMELSDRIMVLCQGEVTGIVNAKEATKEQIGLMMTGKSEVRDE